MRGEVFDNNLGQEKHIPVYDRHAVSRRQHSPGKHPKALHPDHRQHQDERRFYAQLRKQLQVGIRGTDQLSFVGDGTECLFLVPST